MACGSKSSYLASSLHGALQKLKRIHRFLYPGLNQFQSEDIICIEQEVQELQWGQYPIHQQIIGTASKTAAADKQWL